MAKKEHMGVAENVDGNSSRHARHSCAHMLAQAVYNECFRRLSFAIV